MALSFIGKPISLISHSDVRYRGILAGIDAQASTIQLSNVYSMGTESRRPPSQFIAPVQDPYAYIIFRASEVKDLAVDEPAQTGPSVHDDPAVLGASAPMPKSTNPAVAPPPYQTGQPSTPGPAPQQQQQQQPAQQPLPPQAAVSAAAPPPNTNNRRPNPVHTAAASLETVERALGDLRVSGGAPTYHNTHAASGRGGRRGHGHGSGRRGEDGPQINVPKTDFDFESSNAKFDKAAHPPSTAASTTAGTEDGQSDTTGSAAATPGEKDTQPAYNPQKSFFDSLSSSSAAAAAPASGAGASGGAHQGGYRGRRGGGGPGGAGRNRREEERERNVATFGEPGGVGLLGPGGYVGGWGGYGRRGGRPRRGGGGRGGANTNAGANGAPPVQARG